MNLQHQTLATKDMELFEELTDTDLEAVVGGISTLDNLLEGVANTTSQLGRTGGSAIDGVQSTGNTTLDGTQSGVGILGILLANTERGLT